MAENPVDRLKASIAAQKKQREAAIETSLEISKSLDEAAQKPGEQQADK
jgi:hypothetical protein